ncbi:Centrosomal protein of 78 kDa [Terramyces sp. JEL0728]|nr:Centrosomal protein of 78 kDa [Terramyces sp. JEL0728]
MPLKKRISYTAASKMRIISYALCHSQAEASRKYDIHKSMVSRWVHQCNKINKAEPGSKRIGAGKKSVAKNSRKVKIDESEIDIDTTDDETGVECGFDDTDSETTLTSARVECDLSKDGTFGEMKDLYLLSCVATELGNTKVASVSDENSPYVMNCKEDNLDIGNDDIPEKKLDHALGMDEIAAKKGKNGKVVSTPTKKPAPVKGKGKQKGGKGPSKKQAVNQDSLDDKTIALQTDAMNEAKEDENANKNGNNKKNDEPSLCLLEEEDAGWESDLDVSGGCGPEIATMMSDNSTLKTLILSGNEFGDKEATFIAEVLDISRNDIGDIGGIALGNGLLHNEGLRELNVSWNQMRIRGIAGFLNGAKDNTVLSKLDLSHNGVGDNGNCFISYLGKSAAIKSLNLSYTRMDDGSFAGLWKAVESNRSLTELDVSGNAFSAASMMTMLKGLTSTKIVSLIIKVIKANVEYPA